MDFGFGDLMGSGGASVGGDIVSAYAAHREAAMNRDWQAYMSSTAHQREVADLKAAGLNPILSATGGRGASTPGGATAEMPSAIGTRAVSSALSAKLNRELVEKANYDKQTSQWQAEMSNLDFLIKEYAAPDLKDALQSAARAESAHNKQVEKVWKSPPAEVLKWLQLLSPVTGTASSIFNSVR